MASQDDVPAWCTTLPMTSRSASPVSMHSFPPRPTTLFWNLNEGNSEAYDELPAILSLPSGFKDQPETNRSNTAVILISGRSGGLNGPSDIWIGLSQELVSFHHNIPCLRIDYREPGCLKPCTEDVFSGMDYLTKKYAISRFILVGWSFGGAPVMTVAAKDERVVGCATVASQTAGTEGISKLAKRGVPCLFLHGTGDKILPSRCAQLLYDWYGKKGWRKILLFNGDDHSLSHSKDTARKELVKFIIECVAAEEPVRSLPEISTTGATT